MKYTKNNQTITPNTGRITTENGIILNPTEEQLTANGWIEYVDPEPTTYIPTYEQLVEQYIAERYTTSQELAVQRQKDTKVDEWTEYYEYCEECKERAKLTLI